jgi:hypothetical protein
LVSSLWRPCVFWSTQDRMCSTRCLVSLTWPDWVSCGLHLLLMYIHLGFHFFLSGHFPGLDIHLRDESTLKDRLLIIGVYLGIDLFCGDYQIFHHLFHFCRLTVQPTTAISSSTTSDTSCHVYKWL